MPGERFAAHGVFMDAEAQSVRCSQIRADDFVYDGAVARQPIKCPSVIGDRTQESPAVDMAGSIRSKG
jgi:hypothetical protein